MLLTAQAAGTWAFIVTTTNPENEGLWWPMVTQGIRNCLQAKNKGTTVSSFYDRERVLLM